ncbi:Transcription factor che-1 [Toxocara canis]|uniref:Transcription factor che-1 n=1 Tax=Toxocara canis TaxID=6265 RepID=A0A0B2W3G4_TOXCA|nr:Transcription factor che-1 [Toxocara canis]
MSYSQYDADYLFDQYHFQPPRSTHVANFMPQGDFYGWPSDGVCASSQPVDIEMSHWREVPLKADPASMHQTSVVPSTHQNIFEVSAEETRMHSCPTCHKQYCRKSTLKAHMKQHLGHRPFSCQVCGKSFSQAANLTAHKRVHTGEKPFSCPICLRPFSQSSSLVTHKRTHTGERPYPCAHCDKAFTDSSTLTKHLRTHTGQKPYNCHLCMMRFTQSGNLHRHMKTHRSEY